MKVVLACPGVGQVQRGYERFFTDLFSAVKDDADVTLYKGAGPTGPREIVPRFVRRTGKLGAAVPLHWTIGRSRYHFECLTFGLALVRGAIRQQADIVHIIDPPLIKVVHMLRRQLGGKFRILFSHAGTLPFGYHPYADYVVHIGPDAYDADLKSGFPVGRLALLPIGINTARFKTPLTKEQLRQKHNVPADTKVILSVAALNRHAKRVDYVIEEAAQLRGNFLLWLDGSFDPDGDPSLVDLARKKLGDRCRFTHVPSETLGELFALADVKVLGSLHEAFGLAVVEAMACGLPAIVNDTPHFRWLVGDRRFLADLSKPGTLATRLGAIIDGSENPASFLNVELIRRRFSWESLARDYLNLYRAVAAGAPLVQPPEHLPASDS